MRSFKEWLSRIDYVESAIVDGHVVDEAVFGAAGICPTGTTRIPPNRVAGNAEIPTDILMEINVD